MKKFELMFVFLVVCLILNGCGLVREVDAGNVVKLSDTETVLFGNRADVSVVTSNGILKETVTVTEPVRAMSVKGKNLPNVQTASWFTFDIRGAKEISDMYASNLDGSQTDFGPANECVFLGRVYKLDNGYGVLIPNGYGTTLTNGNGEITLKGGDINIRIGDKVFTGRK